MTVPKFPGKVFVSVADVKDHLADYAIFDCRYKLTERDYGKVEYAKAHLPGALRADVDEDLSEISPLSSARHPLPPCDKFVTWCLANGITSGKPVLCYDADCGAMGGCRLWWMLQSLGVEAYVIDGGMQACVVAELPMEAGETTFPPVAAAEWPFGTVYQHHLLVQEITPNAVLTDARPSLRFSSTVRPYAADTVPGHMDGAVNLPYAVHLTTAAEGTHQVLRNDAELRANVLGVLKGLVPEDGADLSECVFSCGSGLSACINIAIAQQVGLGLPYLYCGSWSEYSGLYRVPMRRSIVQHYGLYIELQTPSLGEHPKANTAAHVLEVDGVTCADPDEEVKSVLAHLHLGEKATVYFKSCRTVSVAVSKAA